jgi:glycosyltransferase involved in cell wall biosynthesis
MTPKTPVRALFATNIDRGGAAILVARTAIHIDPTEIESVLYLPREGFVAEIVGDRAQYWFEPDFVTPPTQKIFGWKRLLEVIETRSWAASHWIRAAKKLVMRVKEEKIEVIYAFGVEPQIFCAIVGALAQIPVVWSALQTFDDGLDELPLQLVSMLPTVRSIVAVSEAAAAPYRKVGSKPTVIFNGVDPSEFTRETISPMLRDRYQLSAETPLVAVMGRPSREKGFDVFLQAAAQISREIPEARFVMLGAGASEKHLAGQDRYAFERRLSELPEQLGIADKVIWTGPVEDVRPLLADIDVVALPSRRDAAPLVAFEAMAMQIPIVGSAVHGIPELITNDIEGLLVPSENETALAEGVVSLLRDRQRRSRMGKAGRARVERDFDIRKNCRLLAAHLREIARPSEAE